METQTNFHPEYVSGQYLTSEHLNETHEFLWQEEKATRYLVAGDGITFGMNADYVESGLLQKVSLSKGAASTIDGYLVNVANDITFSRAIDIGLVLYKVKTSSPQLTDSDSFAKIKDGLDLDSTLDLPGFEMYSDAIADKDLPEGVKKMDEIGLSGNDAFANYIVLLWVFIDERENNQCQQGDCNTKGKQVNYITRFFLVKNTDFAQLNSVHPELPTCAVARIKNLSTAGSKDGLNQKSFVAWNISFGELLPYFSTDASEKQLNKVAVLLTPDDKNQLENALQKFKEISASVNEKSCPQYYSLFAADLAKAINELVTYYNDYVSRYPTFSSDRLERVIVVGSLRAAGIDKWRYYFIPAPELNKDRFYRKKLEKLFRRVMALVENFILQANIINTANLVQAKPQVIPTANGDNLLQNSAIAYYFDIRPNDNNENDILKYWNPCGGNLKNVYCYYDSIVAVRNDMAGKMKNADWYNQNFFRIEGHVGLSKQVALTALTNLIRNEGLPIQVIDCDINYKGPQKWISWYDMFVNNVGKWTKDLKKDYKDYDYSRIKKIHEDVTHTSFRDIDKVTKIFNDFSAYSGVFYNAPAAPHAARAGAAGGIKVGIPTSAYEQFKKVIKKDEVAAINKNYRDAVAEQTDMKAQKLTILSDLVDIEYLGGAVRGGTFVLLHDGTTVIGDGSLPYFYRINQVRVFNS